MSFRQMRSEKCGFQQLLLGCRKMRACQPVYVGKASLCNPACIASLHTWTGNLMDMCLTRCSHMHWTPRTDMSIVTLHACTCIYVRVHQDTRGTRLECAADMLHSTHLLRCFGVSFLILVLQRKSGAPVPCCKGEWMMKKSRKSHCQQQVQWYTPFTQCIWEIVHALCLPS